MANIKITVESSFTEKPQSGTALPVETVQVEVNALHRFTVQVPAKVGEVMGTATLFLPEGYHTDPNVLASFVPFTASQLRILGVLTASGHYNTASVGASSIDDLTSIVLHCASCVTGKLVYDSPLILTNQEGGLQFSDYFGTETPYKVEFFNASTTQTEIEVILGILI